MPAQIALSVLVLQVFRRGSVRWLWLAIVAHMVVDLLAVLPSVLPLQGFPAILLIEALITVAGVVAGVGHLSAAAA